MERRSIQNVVATGKEGEMKKPDMCKENVEICENCRNWEPIPFHDDGGVCIPPMEVIVVKSAPRVIEKETEKVPVAV
jgi:hypothetical protein